MILFFYPVCPTTLLKKNWPGDPVIAIQLSPLPDFVSMVSRASHSELCVLRKAKIAETATSAKTLLYGDNATSLIKILFNIKSNMVASPSSRVPSPMYSAFMFEELPDAHSDDESCIININSLLPGSLPAPAMSSAAHAATNHDNDISKSCFVFPDPEGSFRVEGTTLIRTVPADDSMVGTMP